MARSEPATRRRAIVRGGKLPVPPEPSRYVFRPFRPPAVEAAGPRVRLSCWGDRSEIIVLDLTPGVARRYAAMLLVAADTAERNEEP